MSHFRTTNEDRSCRGCFGTAFFGIPGCPSKVNEVLCSFNCLSDEYNKCKSELHRGGKVGPQAHKERPAKSAAELDAEMEVYYFGSNIMSYSLSKTLQDYNAPFASTSAT